MSVTRYFYLIRQTSRLAVLVRPSVLPVQCSHFLYSNSSYSKLTSRPVVVNNSTKPVSGPGEETQNSSNGNLQVRHVEVASSGGNSDLLKKFAHELYEVKSIDQLNNFITSLDKSSSLSLNEICLLLRCYASNAHVTEGRVDSLESSSHIKSLVEQLNSEIVKDLSSNIEMALSALGSLLKLRADSVSQSVKADTVSQSVKADSVNLSVIVFYLQDSMMNRMSMNQLIRLLVEVIPSHLNTEFSVNQNDHVSLLRQETLIAIERRWVEITLPKDIVSLLCVVPPDSERLISRLVERALDNMDNMSIKQLYRLLYHQAKQQQRKTPLLRSVVYNLNKQASVVTEPSTAEISDLGSIDQEDNVKDSSFNLSGKPLDEVSVQTDKPYPLYPLSFTQLCNVAYSCATLSVYNEQLMKNICESAVHLLSHSDHTIPTTLLTNLLHSCALLRYYDNNLLSLIVKHVSDSLNTKTNSYKNMIEKISSKDLMSLVTSMACLNHSFPDRNKFLRKMIDGLIREYKSGSSVWSDEQNRLWLDFVWSCAVLKSITEELAETVLDKNFVERVQKLPNPVPSLTRLMNINSQVTSSMPWYKGSKLNENLISNIPATSMRKSGKLKTSLVEALSSVLSMEKYVKLDVQTPCGYVIDAEMIINDSGQPQPITAESTRTAPGLHRVAIKLLDFPDMTFGSVEGVTGYHALGLRLMKKAGYIVVPMTYKDFPMTQPVARRMQVLQTEIRKTVTRARNTDERKGGSVRVVYGKEQDKPDNESLAQHKDKKSLRRRNKQFSSNRISIDNIYSPDK